MAALAVTACMDDVDVDKISGDVNIKPTLLIPLAYSDVNTEYLYDQASNAVEHYTAEDGTNRVRLRANHDSISAYPVMNALGLSGSSKTLKHNIDFSELDFTYSSGSDMYEAQYTISLPIVTDNAIVINSLSLDYTIRAEYAYMYGETELTVNMLGDDIVMELGGEQASGELEEKSQNHSIEINGNDIEIPVTVRTKNYRSYTNIDLTFELSNIDNINCSIEDLTIPTSTYISLTHMKNFKRMGRTIEYKNPRLWLTCTNKSPFDGEMRPEICSIGDGRTMLDNDRYEMPAGTVGKEEEINRENSNIQAFFKNVPDSLRYTADLLLSMPQGASSVTITQADTIYLGYRYEVPFEFKINGSIECDTAMISDVPNLSSVKRAKIVCTTTNSMPFGGNVVIQLANLYEDKMLSKIEIKDAIKCPTIVNGLSTNSVENVSTTELTAENLEDLKECDALIISVNLDSNGEFVAPQLKDRMTLDTSFAAGFEIKNN